jgi:hypothetical protein
MKSTNRNRIRKNGMPTGIICSFPTVSDEETTTKIISAMVESAKTLYNSKYTRDQYIDVLAKYAKRIMNES